MMARSAAPTSACSSLVGDLVPDLDPRIALNNDSPRGGTVSQTRSRPFFSQTPAGEEGMQIGGVGGMAGLIRFGP